MSVRKEKDGKRKEEEDGCQVSYGRKSFSRRSSPSMVERSGTGTCWQDGHVGGVSDKHSVSVAREAQASRLHGAGGAHRTRLPLGVRTNAYWIPLTELHALREKVKRYEYAEKTQEAQRQPASAQGRSHDDGKMEVDD